MAPKTSIQRKLAALKAVVEGKRRLLIVLQDTPDPDALASAAALKTLIRELTNIPGSITHRGEIGRAENRALVQYLRLNMRQCDCIEFDRFDLIAMVDTQPYTGNNGLPEHVLPDIVIDHHPCKRSTYRVPFHDVRGRYGATSSILYEYLNAAGIVPSVPLATALFYGIRSDTQDLGRDCIEADIRAGQDLFVLANKRALSEIQRGHVRRSYYHLLARALANTQVYGDAAVSNLGGLNHADMIAEAADLLLRDDNISAVMCYGVCENRLCISLRTRDPERRSDHLIHRIVSRLGTGGGHPNYAGGQIPLKTPEKRQALEATVTRRFLKALKLDTRLSESLLDAKE
ncbi:MAG: bifunctional oligoribonuclease/PAP phosphatase NrnA [Phycisphaerae bacterium]|nr:bifunctional oligoribonuclease/PAP phosphatase NrnA [Phycisphaerae bacterium]